MRTYLLLSLVLLASACGDDSAAGPDLATTPDLAMSLPDLSIRADMAFVSRCGRPGDVGNSLGVGKFCARQDSTQDDCKGNGNAVVCSLAGNDPAHPELNTFFCLFLCSPTSPAGFCGENASCQCQNGECGCTPNSCALSSGDMGPPKG